MLDSLEELTAFLKPFKEEEEKVNTATEGESDVAYHVYKKYVIEHVELPEFFTTEEPSHIYTIRRAEGLVFQLFNDNNELIRESTDIVEIYHSVSSKMGDVVFEGTYDDISGIKTMGKIQPTLFVENPGKHTGTMLISHTSEDSLYLDKDHYLEFLKTAETYLTDPEDFLTAWYFLASHPYAWYRYDADKEHSWLKHELTSKIWVAPTKNDDGELVFMMEAGAAVPPERTSHYHDLRLDVYADSYESGIVQLAALVHKFYYLDGSERKDVEYEKSELELTLEQRLEEIQSYSDEPSKED